MSHKMQETDIQLYSEFIMSRFKTLQYVFSLLNGLKLQMFLNFEIIYFKF